MIPDASNSKNGQAHGLTTAAGSVPVLVSRETFRSKPYVNMDDDMVRVTIDMSYRHWCIHKEEILAQNSQISGTKWDNEP